jgi:hypothetical protein
MCGSKATGFASALVLLAVLAWMNPALAAELSPDPAVNAAEEAYAAAVEQAKKEHAQRVEKAKADLVTKLKTAMQAATKRGDLDTTLALRDRINAIEAGSTAKTIDLLPLVDLKKHAVNGVWVQKNGVLYANAGAGTATFKFPYRPPAEYDFTVEFTRTDGNDAVDLLVAGGDGGQVQWVVGGYANTLFGFELVKGERADRNSTSTRGTNVIENGRRYTAVVKVRKGGAQGFVDGKLVSEVKTDFTDVSLMPKVSLGDSRAVGLLTFNSAIALRSVKITEVSGAGEVLTEPVAAPAK